MLDRIKEVLGHDARSPLMPESLPPFHWKVAELDGVDLVAQFMAEVEQVGGKVTQSKPERVKEHLEELLPTSLNVSVALSDGAGLERLGIGEWLARSGRRIVPALKEFIAAELQTCEPNSTSAPRGEGIVALIEQYKSLLLEAEVGITTADFGLADTGTLVIVSGSEQHRLISLLPPTHICLLEPSRILPSLTELLARLCDRFGQVEAAPKNITCITGPSRTADIEQTITMGVHGPKSLHVILYSPLEGGVVT